VHDGWEFALSGYAGGCGFKAKDKFAIAAQHGRVRLFISATLWTCDFGDPDTLRFE
jgi:hypothetical protein